MRNKIFSSLAQASGNLIFGYFEYLIYMSVGGGLQEAMTTSWPVNWTWAIGGSSLHPKPWNIHSAHHFHTRSCLKDSLERVRWC